MRRHTRRRDLERVWVEDAVPQGAYQAVSGDSWNWVTSWHDGSGWGGGTVQPHSGRWWTTPLMHVSANVPNAMHQHFFYSSVATMRPLAGDVLYAYVNLDSSYPPAEVMLQWYVLDENGNGSWEHRAYWGANNINWGSNGTASRKSMGMLPGAGNWVRLEVPAADVGLEGKVVEGMAFALWGGRAAWDSAGTINPDHDGDGLPDWWEIEHFGNLLQAPNGENGDYDGDGVTNLEEYDAGSDPNTILFYVNFDNLYVRASSATGAVTVLRGHAEGGKMAVLVDPPNRDNPSWVSYRPDISAALGTAEGGHTVWIGVKGRAASSLPTWVGYSVIHDTVAPLVIVTNPASATVSQPFIQLRGYSPEPIQSIHYDLQNAAGTVADVEGHVTSQYFDPAARAFTTNWFECLDLSLTNGANIITLRVTDLAGNTTTNIHSYTLDYSGDTTAPVLTVHWPENGATLSGESFTFRGRVDDPTATVMALITDESQAATEVAGVVERDGLVWVEGLPLSAGTNTLVLTIGWSSRYLNSRSRAQMSAIGSLAFRL